MFTAAVKKHQFSPAMATRRLLKNWSESEMRLKSYPKPGVLKLHSLQRVLNATGGNPDPRFVVLDMKVSQLSTIIINENKLPLNKFLYFYTE